jgi:hypothetical protein
MSAIVWRLRTACLVNNWRVCARRRWCLLLGTAGQKHEFQPLTATSYHTVILFSDVLYLCVPPEHESDGHVGTR